MKGRRSCRPAAITLSLAAALALGACQRDYEPIEVWDPNRPAPSAAAVPDDRAVQAEPVERPSARPPRRSVARASSVQGGTGPAIPAESASSEPAMRGVVLPPPLPQRRLGITEPKAQPPAVEAPPPPAPPATVQPAAPVPTASPPAASTPAAAPVPAQPAAGGSVTVRPGETLFAISRRTTVPVRALIDANDLKPPYRLLAGQRITVPANRFHEVQPGETIYSVSRRYGVAMSVLVRDNGLDAPYGVRAGERLKIPSVSAPAAETMVASLPPSAANPQHVLQLPQAPAPQPGQVLRPPADAAPPPAQVLRPPPDAAPQVGSLPPPETAPPAGFLTLPPGYAPEPVLPPAVPSRSAAPPPEAAPPAPPVETPPPPRAGRRGAPPAPPPPAPPVEAAPSAPTAPAPIIPPPRSPPPAMAAVAPPAVPVLPPAAAGPPPREGRGFIWPVRGQVVTRFGPAGRGLHNDGINIAAPKGTTVVAAEAGIVAYAGNELRGFGNLLLIKHADGWITAYAHNDSLLVKRGDRIRRGQPVARVGQTGNVGEPQLHFELRRGTRAVDPTEHLDSQATDAAPGLRDPDSRAPAPTGAPGALPGLRRRPGSLLAALPGPG